MRSPRCLAPAWHPRGSENRGVEAACRNCLSFGANDGGRTRDIQDHNLPKRNARLSTISRTCNDHAALRDGGVLDGPCSSSLISVGVALTWQRLRIPRHRQPYGFADPDLAERAAVVQGRRLGSEIARDFAAAILVRTDRTACRPSNNIKQIRRSPIMGTWMTSSSTAQPSN